MSFKKINNITGWAVFLIASTVYLMTMEATGSFWDCGEFVSSAYKLQIPHPPGAPLFVLLGRLFTIPFDAHHASQGVNIMSALASGFTILFLFWTITHFARKIVQNHENDFTANQLFSIMAAGVIGALAYTFSDSFWYSAVEGEVYALSSFFTAIVFWAILKWEHEVTLEQREGIRGNFTRADRWLILIFYLIGLAVGVHLLNILTIPAIVMIYYFKKYTVTRKRTIYAFLIGCIATGIVQVPMIQWTIKLAGQFDILFKNSFGMPFFFGFGFFFVLLGVLIFYTIRIANRRNWNFLKLAMWSFAFVLLGFSTYYTTLIRSSADPTVDMFNVDNPVSLVGYLTREQYGDWPLLYGQDFTADPEEQKPIDTYIKGKDKYEKKGRKYDTKYADADKHFLPRMWDASNDQGHADYYLGFTDNITKNSQTGAYEGKPSMGDNIKFAIGYQTNWMYLRYFMWNFAGKQNDIQGIDIGNRRDGNWKTGISFWDNIRLGDQSKMPDSIKHNKANNSLFALPLILGILGLIYQYKKDKRDTLVVGLLFFFTGFAIVFYLNQAGNQPRERDYAYVGSFYAFAIWIGLGVLFVKEQFNKFMDNRIAGYVAAAVCTLAVPVLMAFQEWDDHDRSKKVLARDLATDYLESCAPNAILITFGDNDTYPLWYAQEVEGVRRDIRVINSSLLGTDWYINQLRYKVNQSDPIDLVWTPEQIMGSKRDMVYFFPDLPGSTVTQNQSLDLYTLLKDYAGSEDPNKMYLPPGQDEAVNVFPTKNVKVPVDIDLVRKNGTVNLDDDSVLNEISFTIPKNGFAKNDAAILNIIAANKWKRPIYFTSPYGDLGFEPYLRTDGLTYRLVPVKVADVNRNWVLDKMLNKFVFGNADKKGVYFDEENRRHLNTIRMQYSIAALSLADHDRKGDAKKLLEKCDKMMLQENFPYGMVSRDQRHNQISGQFLLAAYKAGDTVLASKVYASLRKDLEQEIAYFNALDEDKQGALVNDNQRTMQLLQQVQQMEQYFKTPQPVINPETGKPIVNNPDTNKKLQDTNKADKTKSK
ncbi:MAG TPA: DUF2723 domain-containing protein [Chitinophagaceae bacterium]|nr:DUF2723 domain-containing protein [Chitinophagaceae bacterium]